MAMRSSNIGPSSLDSRILSSLNGPHWKIMLRNSIKIDTRSIKVSMRIKLFATKSVSPSPLSNENNMLVIMDIITIINTPVIKKFLLLSLLFILNPHKIGSGPKTTPFSIYSEVEISIRRDFLFSGTSLSRSMVSIPFTRLTFLTIISSAIVNLRLNLRQEIP